MKEEIMLLNKTPAQCASIEQKLRNIINKNKPKHIIIDGKKYYISRPKIDEIKFEEEKVGGIIPLIPLIIGGIAAAGSVAGGAAGIAKAVDDKKAHVARQRELERHNKELEKIAKGSGIEPRIAKGGNILKPTKDITIIVEDFIKSMRGIHPDDKRILKETLQFLAKVMNIELVSVGDGLYLNPYRGEGITTSTAIHPLKESIKSFSKMQKQLNDNDKLTLKNTLNNLADHIKIEKLGDGLYLNPNM